MTSDLQQKVVIFSRPISEPNLRKSINECYCYMILLHLNCVCERETENVRNCLLCLRPPGLPG